MDSPDERITPPVEYQGAAALAGTFHRSDPTWPPVAVQYVEHAANVVVFTVNGVTFHAVVTVA